MHIPIEIFSKLCYIYCIIIAKCNLQLFTLFKYFYGGIFMKTKKIYGICTTDDERSSSIKCYCATTAIAKRELKNYRDFFASKPPKPDAKHIIPIDLIIE